ncbi:helix-turn-helix domain-containing protein [Streptomyces sp. NPDC097640]|uniref:helix-turn-helix domain-containing protein n=1 Tax=Streptomyces sp. NPDC097640 TaxID=3157229 RepID=UPI003327CFC7
MPDGGWVPVANTTAQSRRLSWRAKGLLLDLLSFPDKYDITFEKLIAMARASGDSDMEGRDAMRRALQELERKGYLAHVRRRVKDEESDRLFWRTETVVCDDPETLKLRVTAFQEAGGSGGRTSSTTEGQEVFNKTGSYKNDQQDEDGKSSSALAGARAGQHAGEQDRRQVELDRLYAAANELDDDRLRRLLLQFEKKRPRVYREQRQSALAQLERENSAVLRGPQSVRAVDLLSYKYALLHYVDPGIPEWLRRFPR